MWSSTAKKLCSRLRGKTVKTVSRSNDTLTWRNIYPLTSSLSSSIIRHIIRDTGWKWRHGQRDSLHSCVYFGHCLQSSDLMTSLHSLQTWKEVGPHLGNLISSNWELLSASAEYVSCFMKNVISLVGVSRSLEHLFYDVHVLLEGLFPFHREWHFWDWDSLVSTVCVCVSVCLFLVLPLLFLPALFCCPRVLRLFLHPLLSSSHISYLFPFPCCFLVSLWSIFHFCPFFGSTSVKRVNDIGALFQ